MPDHLSANVERFAGFADQYDAYRPQPPLVIADILAQLAQVAGPRLVIDLGSGTGLSTRIWARRAHEVLGIEPSDDMRAEAEERTRGLTGVESIRYAHGFSISTGLPDGVADIVTCSQSLHWMEPDPTFAEIARILRPGGVFAAYDCDWPPTVNWEAEAAYSAFMERVHALENQLGVYNSVRRWTKDGHLARIRESGRFRYVKEILVHNTESGDADRLVGLALSQGGVETLLKQGLSEDEIGLTEMREAASRILGSEPSPWYFSYRVRVGVK